MEPARHRDGSPPWRFDDLFLVRCPRCRGQARVVPEGEVGAWRTRAARLTCPACALIREWDGRLHLLDADGRPLTIERSKHTGSWLDVTTGRPWRGGDPVGSGPFDPYFGSPLWLQAVCCGGHTFWAYNAAHLDYLAAFIAAPLRERSTPLRTLTWNLPKWMKDGKHRAELGRHIARLRADVP